ncbi:MAG: hypothetical protein KBA31_10655 [Alphaproteobacteria bacterium]|nr:hypothetical protein [Alphaproteobacteria bacterium]
MRTVIGIFLGTAGALGLAAAAPPEVTIPGHVQMPELKPLISTCSDPAADHWLEIDISQRPPPGAARVQKISGWTTEDGVFHWPFVMRIRNIGDKPFVGKPGKQSVVVTEDDVAAGKKGRVVASFPFDRIEPRSGVAARFLFEAPAADMNKGKFHRIYTLSIKYGELSEQIVNGQFGDCELKNNNFVVEIDGGRKGWIFGR